MKTFKFLNLLNHLFFSQIEKEDCMFQDQEKLKKEIFRNQIV